MSDSIRLSVGAIPPVEVRYTRITDLGTVPDSAGWYCWFYVPTTINGMSLEVNRYFEPMASIQGFFHLEYAGKIASTLTTRGKKLLEGASGSDEQQIRQLFLAFSQPLYVGISRTLKTRLKKHAKQLFEYIDDATAQGVSEPNIDTDEESAYFGGRIGKVLCGLDLSGDDLYVKYVQTDDLPSLRRVEKIINYSLTPHYGRK